MQVNIYNVTFLMNRRKILPEDFPTVGLIKDPLLLLSSAPLYVCVVLCVAVIALCLSVFCFRHQKDVN